MAPRSDRASLAMPVSPSSAPRCALPSGYASECRSGRLDFPPSRRFDAPPRASLPVGLGGTPPPEGTRARFSRLFRARSLLRMDPRPSRVVAVARGCGRARHLASSRLRASTRSGVSNPSVKVR